MGRTMAAWPWHCTKMCMCLLCQCACLSPASHQLYWAVTSSQPHLFDQALLIISAFRRWSPKQALQHPFITRALFTGPFQPTPDSPLPARSLGIDYGASSNIANGHAAALMYASNQGQSAAALAANQSVANSPEARAHLAAMAAVAHLSPHSAFPSSSSLPAASQAAMLQLLDSAMQSAAAGAMQVPPRHLPHRHQQQQSQQHQALMPDLISPHGGSLSGTPHSQRMMASRHHTTGSDSASSSMGGNFTPSMSAHQSPYGSYQLQQQQQQQYQSLGRFGSISQSPVALPVPIQGQMSSHLPVGSLEALRGGWHAPRGRNAYGDMFASSLTVPSQRLAGAASLAGSLGGGSLAGSFGPPRLPPSLNNRPRHSFSTSPGGAVLSPSLATPPMAATPNRVFGFGSSGYSDQQQTQQLQQHLPRQHSLQQRQYVSPHHQHRQRQQPGHDSIEHLFDDWAGQGAEGNLVRHMSRQPSLDAPHPSDWDPNFR